MVLCDTNQTRVKIFHLRQFSPLCEKRQLIGKHFAAWLRKTGV